jgi:hypothetical protein
MSDELLWQVTVAIHNVDCPDWPGCHEDLTVEGRYGRYAAAALAVINDDHEHMIELRPGGWTMQHPLSCRLSGELFACPYHQAAQGLGPMDQLGRYVCRLVDGRVLIGDPV